MKKDKIIVYDPKEYPIDPFEWEDIKKSHDWISKILNWKISTAIFFGVFFTLVLFLPFKNLNLSSQQYLLSSIFQGMAAVFALGITGLLVGLQLLNNKYSYRGIKYLPKSAWNLVSYIMIYALILTSTLILLYDLNKQIVNFPPYGIIICFEIALASALIVYTGNKLSNIVTLLDPKVFFKVIYNEITTNQDKDYDDILEMFSEIILKALDTYQESTASEGFKTLTYVFLKEITKVPRKEESVLYWKIYSKYRSQIELYAKIAREKSEVIVTREIVKELCIIAVTSFKNRANKYNNRQIIDMIDWGFDYLFNLKYSSLDENKGFRYNYFITESSLSILQAISFIIRKMPNNKDYSVDWGEILIEKLGKNLLRFIEDEKVYEQKFMYVEMLVYDLQSIFEEILKNDDLLTNRYDDVRSLLNILFEYIGKYIIFLCSTKNYYNNGKGIINNLLNIIDNINSKNKIIAERNRQLIFKREIIKLSLLIDIISDLPEVSDCLSYGIEKIIRWSAGWINKKGNLELPTKMLLKKLDKSKIVSIYRNIILKKDVSSETIKYFKSLLNKKKE